MDIGLLENQIKDLFEQWLDKKNEQKSLQKKIQYLLR